MRLWYVKCISRRFILFTSEISYFILRLVIYLRRPPPPHPNFGSGYVQIETLWKILLQLSFFTHIIIYVISHRRACVDNRTIWAQYNMLFTKLLSFRYSCTFDNNCVYISTNIIIMRFIYVIRIESKYKRNKKKSCHCIKSLRILLKLKKSEKKEFF